MQFRAIQRILGLLLMVFSLTMLPPIGIAWFYAEPSAPPFIASMLLVAGAGVALWFPARRARGDLRLRDGFVIVVAFWLALGVTGSVPLLLSDTPDLSVADAVFESVSGLTTTGATVITGLDHLPRAVLFYRHLLQWLGGMGIIVLAVAIAPMLGIGGMQLYRAETPGPMKDSKLTPRITETAKALWYLYLLLTVLCGLAYRAAGMDGTFTNPLTALRIGVFQAVSISTTTGFTTADYHTWPSFLPVLLLFASFVGGCAGSTGGGLKVIRVLLLYKQGMREIVRLVHPNARVPIKVGGTVMPPRVIDAVWGFFATYVATFSLLLLALMATGLDQVTAFSAVAACMNNLGPGLGGVGLHYASISDTAKWLLSLAMLLGRLEIFTLLVLLSPAFWRG